MARSTSSTVHATEAAQFTIALQASGNRCFLAPAFGTCLTTIRQIGHILYEGLRESDPHRLTDWGSGCLEASRIGAPRSEGQRRKAPQGLTAIEELIGYMSYRSGMGMEVHTHLTVRKSNREDATIIG